jgi:hypothetical protein
LGTPVDSLVNMTIKPWKSGSYLLKLDEFGFGKTNKLNSSEYYISIINNYEEFNDTNTQYAFWSNTSNLAMNFRGLGLPND